MLNLTRRVGKVKIGILEIAAHDDLKAFSRINEDNDEYLGF